MSAPGHGRLSAVRPHDGEAPLFARLWPVHPVQSLRLDRPHRGQRSRHPNPLPPGRPRSNDRPRPSVPRRHLGLPPGSPAHQAPGRLSDLPRIASQTQRTTPASPAAAPNAEPSTIAREPERLALGNGPRSRSRRQRPLRSLTNRPPNGPCSARLGKGVAATPIGSSRTRPLRYARVGQPASGLLRLPSGRSSPPHGAKASTPARFCSFSQPGECARLPTAPNPLHRRAADRRLDARFGRPPQRANRSRPAPQDQRGIALIPHLITAARSALPAWPTTTTLEKKRPPRGW